MRRSLRTFTLLLSLLLLVASAVPATAQITIADARQQGDGATVTVEGVVTRALGSFVRFQDASGATGASGLVIRQTSGTFNQDVQDGTITEGTQLRVEGTLSTFNGLLQINEGDLASYSVEGQTTVPQPQSVTLSDLNNAGEDYESELVTISGLTLVDDVATFSSDATYAVSDQSTTFDLRVQGSDESNVGGTPAPASEFTYTGVVGQFDRNAPFTTGYQLIPVRRSDIQGGVFFAFASGYNVSLEADGTVMATVQAFNVADGQSVSVSVAPSTDGTADPSTDLSGSVSPSSLTFTGPNPAPQSISIPIADDGMTEGVEFLELTLSSSDGASRSSFTQWILDDATAQGPVSTGLEGTELLTQLTSNFGNPLTLGYDIARDTMYRVIYNEGGTVQGFYSGYEVAVDPNSGEDPSGQALDGGINTEHIFPQSLGAGDEPARSNMHILVPARDRVNSARSNFPFAEIPDADTDVWFFEDQEQNTLPMSDLENWSELNNSPSDRDDRRFEPRHAVKGDVARAIFYFVMAYPNQATIDFFQVQKADLLQWHADDPVDATEMRRNVLQASYQGNQLNPFVVDPTLVDRTFGILTETRQVFAGSSAESVQIRWEAPLGGIATGYNVYRALQPFTSVDDAQLLNPAPISTTAFTDTAIQIGGTYTYRIAAVDDGGTEGPLSEPVTRTVYPSTVSFSVDQAFGDVAAESSYRLVALPGAVDRALGDALGEPEVDWTAFWDDGTDSDFLTRFDGSDTFRFAPGRGFWLLSSSNWAVDDVVANLPLSNGAVSIPLHDGWNIISNPFPIDVQWSDVDAENGGTTLQPLWSWSGSFQQAEIFASAATGEAFYFFNDSGLTELNVPLSPVSLSAIAPASASLQRAVTLDVRYASAPSGEAPSGEAPSGEAPSGEAPSGEAPSGASVRVAESPDAADGRDRFDYVAPRTSFAAVSMHVASGNDADAPKLARDVRAPSASGHSYRLALNAEAGTPVTITPSSLPSDPSVHVVLIRPDTGTRYDLRTGPATITPTAASTDWMLLVGTDAFVKGTAPEHVTEIAVEPPSPNPFRQQTTLRYVLPEANEVTVRVYDVLGRRIHTLMDRQQPSGSHQLQWNGTSGSGAPVASGMYFLRVRIGDTETVHKVVHVR